MVTLKDVAKLAGVSPCTVSRVLSRKAPVQEKTRQRVLESIKELNYFPNLSARALKEGKTKTIGFFIPNLQNLIYPILAVAIQAEAWKHGYSVIFCDTQESQKIEKEYVEKLKGTAVDGFIFSTSLVGKNSRTILSLKEEGYPVVSIMRDNDVTTNTFVSDNKYGGYLAARYLIEKGHRNIATVYGNPLLALYPQRTEGFYEGLARSGMEPNPDLAWQCDCKQKYEVQRLVAQKLKEGYRPDAIFAQSDPIAIDVKIAITSFGLKVPQDIAVIGFDNVGYSENFDLTTVEQPFIQIANDATAHLIDILEQRASPVQPEKVYPVRIIERGSA
ncbi:LacI family transcriptional regulator [Caproiciproducens sp. NJN-50]|uniref:LacI family DNA-binding transcriptional regulator n=1 Tax=Caproiciproducens sp. NJN-50 TaxID=2507162 RepID=UPI000FFE1DC0|nr:LacI family DNA-binding transcriptional regulator [Caproiciproducens sp. NJN-50]QAT48781.1 LacI family transcriptional regulator [Caproiciproducens sp. NJN-50]